MRFFLLLLAITLTTTPALAGWKTIKSEAELQEKVVGRSFIDPESKAWFRLRKNGKLVGAARKQKLTGAWQWKSGFVCFNRKLGGEKLPSDCVVMQFDRNNIATIRKSGKGRKTAYRP